MATLPGLNKGVTKDPSPPAVDTEISPITIPDGTTLVTTKTTNETIDNVDELIDYVSGDNGPNFIPQLAIENLVSDLALKEDAINKGAISGYAGLDASQELLLANFPSGTDLQVLRRNAGNTALEFFTLSDLQGITSINTDTTAAQIIAVGTGLGIVDAGATHTLSIDSTVVTLTGTQILTNKTLTTPTIGDFTNAIHDHEDAVGGGQLLSTAALSDTTDIAYLNTSNVFTSGMKQSVQHDTTNAGFRIIPSTGNPSTQIDGDMWLNSTTDQLFARINGANVDLGAGAGGGENNTIASLGGGTVLTAAVPKSGVQLQIVSIATTGPLTHSVTTDLLTFDINELVDADLATGVFASITGIGAQTQNLDMNSNNILNFDFIATNATEIPAAGAIRLGNQESIVWRNQADSADIFLSVGIDDRLELLNGVGINLGTDDDIRWASSFNRLIRNNAGGFEFEVETGDSIDFLINNVSNYEFDAAQADFHNNALVNAPHNHQDAAGGGQLLSTAALSDTANIAYLNTANAYSAGVRQDFLGLLAGTAGLNVGGIAGNPTTQVNGDIWLNSTSNQLFGRINGADVDLGAAGGGEVFTWTANHDADRFNLIDAGAIEFPLAGPIVNPLATSPSIYFDDALTPDALILNVPSTNEVLITVNGVEEYTFSSSIFLGNGNILRGFSQVNVQDTTTPLVVIENTTSSPAVTATIGEIRFRGDTSGGGLIDYGNIVVEVGDNSVSSADGEMRLEVVNAASQNVEYITLNETQSQTIHFKKNVQDFTLDPTTGTAEIAGLEGLRFTDDATQLSNSLSYIQRSNSSLITNSPTGEDIQLQINNSVELTIALNLISTPVGTDLNIGGDIIVGDRFQGNKGPDVVGAATVTLGDGNYFDITGNTNIDFMTITGWQTGSVIVLQFDANSGANDNTAAPPVNTVPFALAGDFNASAGDTLTVVLDGSFWREISRSVN